jgi:alcohol dehydrogenase
VLRFNAPQAGQLYAELAAIILPNQELPQDPVATTELLADYFLSLAGDLGLQTSLQQMNISESALPMLAEEAMLQQRLLINNPREVSLDDALTIYQQAF